MYCMDKKCIYMMLDYFYAEVLRLWLAHRIVISPCSGTSGLSDRHEMSFFYQI